MNPLIKEKAAGILKYCNPADIQYLHENNASELSEKQIKRQHVEKRRRNITMNLKEENDRASITPRSIRKSPRLNKADGKPE